jgi:acetylornithine aminotransferase
MQQMNMPQHVQKIGAYLLDALKKQLSHYPQVINIRGKGLMIGVELDQPCLNIVNLALKHHLLINVVANKTIRLLPPLILSEQEADEIVARLEACLQDFFVNH